MAVVLKTTAFWASRNRERRIVRATDRGHLIADMFYTRRGGRATVLCMVLPRRWRPEWLAQ
jgi:hypothetical protein